MVRVAVVGTGAWGINHVRTFARSKLARLTCICDGSEKSLDRAADLAPGARRISRYEEVLGAPDVDAVVLATPAVLHAEQARLALQAGKHVFVEKPMALRGAEAADLVALAEKVQRTLMVGHLMLYHPAVDYLKNMLEEGSLGRVLYMYAMRVNLGRARKDENAMWSLAPHDISMILYLLGEDALSVSARGGAYLREGVEDVVFLNLRFRSGVIAQIHLRLDPRKERRLTIVGSKKMVEFDDVHPVEKLRIYDKGFDKPPAFTEYAEYMSIRNGDIHIPQVAMAEPLEVECRHFLESIVNRRRPKTDGESALGVVRVLEAASRSLAADGLPVLL